MPASHLRSLPLPTRLGIAALLAVGLAGWAVSLGLLTRLQPDDPWAAFSPEATRLRTCAPPLERAIETHMRPHIPARRERQVLVRWMRRGAQLAEWYGAPQRIVRRRCATCHGEAPQAGVRLVTYGDAVALSGHGGPLARDPYHRRRHLHVHLFAVGTVLALLLLGLGRSRLPPWIALTLGLVPLGGLLATVPLSLWACHTAWAPYLIWLGEGLATLGWPLSSAVLLWDLFAAEPEATPGTKPA